MAKTSQINRNKKREKLVAQYAVQRAALKATADDMKVSEEDRFAARPQAGQAAAQFVQGARSITAANSAAVPRAIIAR